MAAPQAVGTPQTAAVTFNSAILTFGSTQIGEITSVSINRSQNAVKSFVLNKRKASKIRAGNVEFSVSFDIEAGEYQRLIALFYSSSSAVTGAQEYSVKETQPDTPTLYITTYENDDSTKAIQYQLLDAEFTSLSPEFGQESFGKVSVEVDCTEVLTVIGSTVTQ
jgi:hypothetical protein